MLLIDPAGQVQFINPAARRLLPKACGETLAGLPEMAPRTGPVARLLQEAGAGRRAVLPLQAGGDRLLAMATPLSVPVRPGRSADIMLLLVEQDAAPESLFTFLAQGFRLSPCETRLLPALWLGESVAEIAENLDVRVSTVRSQLASIFAKTGCRRQQDLVRLLGVLPRVRVRSGAAAGISRRARP